MADIPIVIKLRGNGRMKRCLVKNAPLWWYLNMTYSVDHGDGAYMFKVIHMNTYSNSAIIQVVMNYPLKGGVDFMKVLETRYKERCDAIYAHHDVKLFSGGMHSLLDYGVSFDGKVF